MPTIRVCLVSAITLLSSIAFYCLLVLFGWVSVSAESPTERGASAPISPVCGESLSMFLTDESPALGDVISVTLILENGGDCQLGLMQYDLSIAQEETLSTLAIFPPFGLSHSGPITPGGSDVANFQLEVVGAGVVGVSGLANYEVHWDYPGPATFTGMQTDPVTVTVVAEDAQQHLIHATGFRVGCSHFNPLGGATYMDNGFDCPIAAGHSSHLRLTNYADHTAALNALDALRGDAPTTPYRCYRSASWPDAPSTPITRSSHAWVADRWLINVFHMDDTVLGGSPISTSNILYDTAVRLAMLSSCESDALFLPLAPTSRQD